MNILKQIFKQIVKMYYIFAKIIIIINEILFKIIEILKKNKYFKKILNFEITS